MSRKRLKISCQGMGGTGTGDLTFPEGGNLVTHRV